MTKSHILIVDDNVDLSSNIREILEEKGYAVECANNGRDAIALTQNDSYDIAIVDIKLPDIPGDEVAREMAEVSPSIEIVYITGFATLDSAIEAVKRDFVVSYIIKPLDMNLLLNTLEQVTRRKHAEDLAHKLFHAVEQSPGTIVITDIEGKIEYVNPKFTQLTGYTYREAIGQNPRMLKTGKTPPEIYECLWKLITSGKEWRGEFCNKKKNGDLYWESASISPIKDSKGAITHFVAVKEDITERKRLEDKLKVLNESLEQLVAKRTEELREKNVELIKEITKREQAEERIKASLKEKEVLLNEVHHRVKNNLQVVSSLLDMSSMQTQNQETIKLFEESRNRVDSIALIHSQLYESERFDEIDMERHIQELSGNLLNIYSKEKTITLDIKSANVHLPVTQAVPCALVLNELISNSLKHAYRDGQQGTMSIIMQQSNGGATLLKVKDDGVGIPEEIDIERTKSLGLRLTRNIVNKQLNGKMKIIRNRGTEVIIEFKHSKEDS